MKCARCEAPNADIEPMDFGPYLGKLICADCWSDECERVHAELHESDGGGCPDCVGPE